MWRRAFTTRSSCSKRAACTKASSSCLRAQSCAGPVGSGAHVVLGSAGADHALQQLTAAGELAVGALFSGHGVADADSGQEARELALHACDAREDVEERGERLAAVATVAGVE